MVKVPLPPDGLDFDAHADTYVTRPVLFRIFKTEGEHPTTWDSFRRYGPVKGMRFDPHTGDPTPRDRGVLYSSPSMSTAFAEVYQRTRVITGDFGATLAAWRPTRDLTLLDLTSDFLVRNGAAAALMMGPKRYTQHWAEAIDTQLGDRVDGLWHISPMTSQPMVTMFERSATINSVPDRPQFHRRIDDSLMGEYIAAVAKQLGYGVR